MGSSAMSTFLERLGRFSARHRLVVVIAWVALFAGVTGVLAVELFETADGDVVVNELAMRPHNSGHWSMDGAVTGQFEQHLRAVLDLPLGDPRPRSTWSVMVNILGGELTELYRSYLHVMARDPAVKVHLYGKAVRPGRKIGHVTVCGENLDDCRARARHAERSKGTRIRWRCFRLFFP